MAKGRELCRFIYPLTLKGTFSGDYKLIDQINGSSGSVMDNIAEGFDRDGKNEFRQFLSISKGSCSEVKSQLYRALDRNHISNVEFEKIYSIAEEIGRKNSNLMDYLNKSGFRGIKFK